MKLGLTGAALAAVMMCGLASRAEASTLTFDFGTRSQFDDYLSGEVSGSVNVKNGSAAIFYTANYMKVIDPDDTGTVVTGSYSGSFSSIIDLAGSQNGNGFVLNFDDGSVSLSFSLVRHGDLLTPSPDDVRIGGESTPYGRLIGEVEFSGSLMYSDLISPVPLPSSSPLFAAAIFALGAAGYARRRMASQG